MLSIEKFYLSMIDERTEKKFMRNVNSIIAVNIFTGLAALILVVASSIGLLLLLINNKLAYSLIVSSGSLMATIFVINLISDSLDPFKKYDLNKSIFILSFFYCKQLSKIQRHNKFILGIHRMKIRVIRKKLTAKLWTLEDNLKNVFGLLDTNKTVELLSELRGFLSYKSGSLIKNGKEDMIIKNLTYFIKNYLLSNPDELVDKEVIDLVKVSQEREQAMNQFMIDLSYLRTIDYIKEPHRKVNIGRIIGGKVFRIIMSIIFLAFLFYLARKDITAFAIVTGILTAIGFLQQIFMSSSKGPNDKFGA